MVDPSIFKAYDVRGLYPDQMDEALAYRIGRAFARVLSELQGPPPSELRVGLGRDMRLSAPSMAEAYARGIADEGADVLDVGMVGTEMLYWTVGSRGLDGGLMCTASHNPKAYTGAKLVKRGALALSGDSGIGELRDIVTAGEPGEPGDATRPDRARGRRRGLPRGRPGLHRRRARGPMRVVLDGGNGMAGPMVGPLLKTFPLDRIETYWEPNGEFPDHEPNPLLEENRRFIVDKVRETGPTWASPGTATPTAASSSTTPASSWPATSSPRCSPRRCCARSPARPSSTTCAPRARCRDVVERAGGTAEVNRVGHAFFKTRMRETGAAFGGEVSGHYYFRDFYCADSGTIPALLILELLSVEGKRMSELLEPLPLALLHLGRDQLRGRRPAGQDGARSPSATPTASSAALDGISIDYDDWHFNVRPSNTEPLLRLNLESLVSRGAHGAEARRGARADPLLTIADGRAPSPAPRPRAGQPAARSAPGPGARRVVRGPGARWADALA